jgi:diguanylate cyclase (GGDEF)-like protein
LGSILNGKLTKEYAPAVIETFKQTLILLIETHPSKRNEIEGILNKIKTKSLDPMSIFIEMRKINQDIARDRDADTAAVNLVFNDINKSLALLYRSKNISAPQKNIISDINLSRGASPILALKSLSLAVSKFAEEAIRLRAGGAVIVGEAHNNLKYDKANIIAGDVAWSSKVIVNSFSPLLKRILQEHPDDRKAKELYELSERLKGKSAVDFYQAIELMEESTRMMAILQRKKNKSEAEHLQAFQSHLKVMHESLSKSISETDLFSRSSDVDRLALNSVINNFKSSSNNEDDPNKLKSLISHNVSNMSNAFTKIIDKQQGHIRKQRMNVVNLQDAIKRKELEYTAIIKKNEELSLTAELAQNLSFIDELTSCPNRRAYEKKLNSIDEILKTSSDSNIHEKNTIMIIDIDKFKAINDTYGHKVGDRALVCFTNLIRVTLSKVKSKSEYNLYRIGGEEFVVIGQAGNLQETTRLADLIRKRLQAKEYRVKGEKLNLTASFGVAGYSTKNNKSEQVFEMADKCLYYAKKTGRNSVVTSENGRMVKSRMEDEFS